MARPFLFCLLLAAPSTAFADRGYATGHIIHTVADSFPRAHTLRAVQTDSAGQVAAVTVRVESDAGEEDVTLIESDAWVHGAAAIDALPTEDVELSLSLYDAGSAALISFSGRLGADGSVTLTADEPTGDATDCTSRVGCDGTATRAPDIEVLAAEVFATSAGYDVGFDIAGADTWDVAYAEIRYTAPCDLASESGICLLGGQRVVAEVDWDEIGSVWENELTLEHAGLLDLRFKTWNAEGRKLDTTNSKLGLPWSDGGDGVSTLATDEDPLTTVGLFQSDNHAWGSAIDYNIGVVSAGWSPGDALPTHAELEIEGGETITIAANSYQRRAAGRGKYWAVYCAREYSWCSGSTLNVVTPTRTILSLSPADLYFGHEVAQVCSDGFCLTASPLADGGYDVSVTEYAVDASELADAVELSVYEVDESGETLPMESLAVVFEDEISAVFSREVVFEKDPVGLDVSGRVKMLGEANRRGRQEVLAKGRFYAGFSRDGDGDVALAGRDRQQVDPWDSAFIAGETNAVVTTPLIVQSTAFTSRLIAVPRTTVYQISL